MIRLFISLAALTIIAAAATATEAADNTYTGAPRTFLYNPSSDLCLHDATR